LKTRIALVVMIPKQRR